MKFANMLKQSQTLALIRQNIDREIQTYTARYHKNPEGIAFNFAQNLSIPDHCHVVRTRKCSCSFRA